MLRWRGGNKITARNYSFNKPSLGAKQRGETVTYRMKLSERLEGGGKMYMFTRLVLFIIYLSYKLLAEEKKQLKSVSNPNPFCFVFGFFFVCLA